MRSGDRVTVTAGKYRGQAGSILAWLYPSQNRSATSVPRIICPERGDLWLVLVGDIDLCLFTAEMIQS